MIRRVITNNRLTSVMLVCLLVIGGFLCLITFESKVVSAGNTWYVGSGAGNDSTTIQGGVNLASDGDAVFVYNGTYYENVEVNRTINLTGENRDTTIIDGGGIGDVIYVSVNWVNITGFTVTGSGFGLGDVGIELNNVQNCSVTNNNISSNNRDGIHLDSSSNNNIKGNIMSSNNWNGIYLSSSSQNNITNNNILNNFNGIHLDSSSNNNIVTNNNIFSNNLYGIRISSSSNANITNNNFVNDGVILEGDQPSHYNTHMISDNNKVNGKPLYYYKDCSGINIDGIPVGQLILANCTNVNAKNLQINGTDVGIEVAYSTNIIITNNNISSNRADGIYLAYSNGNIITGNNISYNYNGISLYSSSNNNVITNNNISSNTDDGIRIREASSNITITNNNISNNGDGIVLSTSSDNNIITNNNILSNNGDGIEGVSSSNNIITNNIIISNNGDGILLASSSNNNVITNNIISNNDDGINPSGGSNNTITNNIISNNAYGISLWGSNNTITNNNISNNGDGIFLVSSSNNRIYHNNFIDNTNQAFDNMNDNIWNDSYPSGGNYWSDFDEPGEGAYDDYQGPDQDDPTSGDGIVDNGTVAGGGKNPYDKIQGGTNQDIYPLINPADTSPPIITNLQPPDGSITNDSNPMIGANYNDPSGINVSSVLLEVDGIDVTPSAIVTASNVSYTPGTALSDVVHTVYLLVKDIYGNLATAMWTFTVDTTPPIITNLQPPDTLTTNDNTPTISADYSDSSGINVSTVVLEVDGIDVTPSATVTASNVSYIPGTALPEGVHTVYLEVRDNVSNLAIATWNFTLDTSPPIITNLQPPNASTTNNSTPIIGADFNDLSGINVSSVLLEVDGINVTSFATITASNITYIPGTALLDDVHTVYLEVKDIYGNLATTTWNFTVDTLPPIITNLQPPDTSTTNDSTSTISADYSDPSGIDVNSVVLMVNGIDVTSSATVTAGDVSYLPVTALPDGIHTVYLEIKDNGGNLATATWSFTVDSTPPTITNLQPPDTSTTNETTPIISADYSDPSGINVSSVVLKVDGIDVTLSATVTASNVTYMPGTVLSDGVHTVYLEVKDIYGNLATATWTFTVDTAPPTITNLQPPDASTTNNTTPTISADYSDPSGINLSSVLLEVDGLDVTLSAIITPSSVSYIPSTALSDGIHTLYIEVKDIFGHLATVSWSFTVDTTPPTIILNSPLNNSVIPGGTLLDFDIIDPNLTQVNYSINGGADLPFSGPYDLSTASWPDGDYTVQINAIDSAGNSISSWYFITIDAAPPVITNLQPPDVSTTNDSTPTIGADYNDLSGINVSSVMLKVDGIDVTSSATVTVNNVSYITGTALSDGVHTVYLEVIDNVGNLATATWSFTVDTTPPTITNLQPPDGSTTNNSTPTIGGNYTDSSGINSSSVLLEVGGVDVTTFATITASGVIYMPGTALSDGIHTVYLEVKDLIGNLATATWSFTVDTTPPITTISPDNYTVKLGTLFTLTANDGVGGCGVNYTQYKIDDGQWIDYLAPFSIDTYEYHNITYRSVDYRGNFETENILSIYVPTVPMTTLIIGTPQYGTTPRYVNYSTRFSFAVIDYSGTGYDTYYYIDTSPPIQYAGVFTVSTEGTHTIYYYSTDNLGNIEDTKEFDIVVDNSPPTTDIVIGEPNYVPGDTWVTSATEFTLNGVDGGLIPVGVNYTKYRIWDGTWSEWGIYQNGFTLGINDGIRYVEFYSIDWLGNEEPVQNRSYIVDDTPPTTTISVGDPRYRDGLNDIWNVTSAATFALSAMDDGAGLNYTEYRIWDNGSWSDWYRYVDGFVLGPENGSRYVEWLGVDYLGNKGMTRNETYFVDNIPPETNYLLLLEPDSAEARISLIPSDIGSGVDSTKYRIDSGDWIIYSSTFVINESGEHVIYFWSADKLGNIEETKEISVLVEKPGTPAPSDEEKKEENNKPLIALIFAIILVMVGLYVSYKRPLKLKDEINKDRLLTWFVVVLPFVIAEIATGVVSLATGMLSVPPLLGIGMVVDLAILVGGLVADGYTYKKGQDIEERSLFTTKS